MCTVRPFYSWMLDPQILQLPVPQTGLMEVLNCALCHHYPGVGGFPFQETLWIRITKNIQNCCFPEPHLWTWPDLSSGAFWSPQRLHTSAHGRFQKKTWLPGFGKKWKSCLNGSKWLSEATEGLSRPQKAVWTHLNMTSCFCQKPEVTFFLLQASFWSIHRLQAAVGFRILGSSWS